MVLAWSYGGGMQSVAIGVLVRQGQLPKPDLAVIADTGRERRTTWDYLRGVMQPYLDPAGVRIEVAPHSLARVGLFDKSGLTLVPAWTAEGRLASFCSGEWKRDVVERWLRLRGVKECDQWIGYSIDEAWRVNKKDHRPWCRSQFPLIDLFINRAMCRKLIQDAGLPLPEKSRCYGCPHQSREEWLQVRADPHDWTLAVAMDREIRERDPEGGELYLTNERVPLEMATFADAEAPSRPCESGHCWT